LGTIVIYQNQVFDFLRTPSPVEKRQGPIPVVSNNRPILKSTASFTLSIALALFNVFPQKLGDACHTPFVPTSCHLCCRGGSYMSGFS
jgi:hypothetical protein